MYYYIYDAFVQRKEYAKELATIENRLADFGITGNIGRLSLFRDASELIADEVRRGAKTVVVVGNDATVRKVITAAVTQKVVFGIIPLGEPNIFAKMFGIPQGSAACEVLARRILLTTDVGKVNGRYFLSRIRIPEADVTLRCEGQYAVRSKLKGNVQIKNMGWLDGEKETPELGDPYDGVLEAVIDARGESGFFRRAAIFRSTIPVKTVTIESEQQIMAFVDEEKYAQPRLEVSILPHRLRIVAGRDRLV